MNSFCKSGEHPVLGQAFDGLHRFSGNLRARVRQPRAVRPSISTAGAADAVLATRWVPVSSSSPGVVKSARCCRALTRRRNGLLLSVASTSMSSWPPRSVVLRAARSSRPDCQARGGSAPWRDELGTARSVRGVVGRKVLADGGVERGGNRPAPQRRRSRPRPHAPPWRGRRSRNETSRALSIRSRCMSAMRQGPRWRSRRAGESSAKPAAVPSCTTGNLTVSDQLTRRPDRSRTVPLKKSSAFTSRSPALLLQDQRCSQGDGASRQLRRRIGVGQASPSVPRLRIAM